MINKNLLEEALYTKFSNTLLKNVVFESFFRGLPLNREDLVNEIYDMKDYSDKVMEALHSETLLDRAIESCTDKNGLKLLTSLKADIKEVSMEAVNRVMESVDTKSADSMNEIVDESDFTPQELKKFQTKGSDISVKEIGNIINKKVIKAIKVEKNEYEENAQLKDKISSALSDVNNTNKYSKTPEDITANADVEDDINEPEDIAPEDSESDDPNVVNMMNQEKPSMDSLFDIILEKTEARSYISLFSKIQDVCLEGILNTNEVYGEIPYGLLSRVTLESTLDVFDRSKISIFDQIQTMNMVTESEHGDMDDHGFKHAMCTAMTCAIVIYTMFETLKTMRLFNPHRDDVRRFIEKPTNIKDTVTDNRVALERRLLDEINNVKRLAMRSMDATDLSNYIDHFNSVKESINSLPDDYSDIKESLTANLESIITVLDEKVAKLSETPVAVEESVFVKRDREANIASLNKIARTYGKKPNVSEIRLVLNPANESNGIVDIEMRNGGNLVDKTFVVLKQHSEFGSYKDCAIESAKLSNLISMEATVNIYETESCKLSSIK